MDISTADDDELLHNEIGSMTETMNHRLTMFTQCQAIGAAALAAYIAVYATSDRSAILLAAPVIAALVGVYALQLLSDFLAVETYRNRLETRLASRRQQVGLAYAPMMKVRSFTANLSYFLIWLLYVVGGLYVFYVNWWNVDDDIYGLSTDWILAYRVVVAIAGTALFSALVEMVLTGWRTGRRLDAAGLAKSP